MKDTALYLEADEDITSAIDKLQKSEAGPVHIVVPKRSTMLQSIINLKLLKKAAETSGKELVLVTSDRIASDLAARVGLAVAPSLGAKAVLSEVQMPEQLRSQEEIIDADDPEPLVPEPAPSKPSRIKRPLLKRREVSDGPPVVPVAAAATSAAASSAAAAATAGGPAPDTAGASTAVKVPNFNRLRRRLVWAGLAVFLVGGYMAFMFFYASAKVTLYVNGSKVDIDTTFAVDPELKQTDKAGAVLAGQTVTVSKDLTGPLTPTGKKDAGTKAAGSITIFNEYDTSAHTLVAGTRFQAPDGKIFRTKADATVPGATVGLSGGRIVMNAGKSDPVAVEADQAGDAYNQAPARYSIPAYTGEMQTKIYGQGAQMSGGTTKTVTVVTQGDVDEAKAELVAKDKDNAARDLKGKLPSGYVELKATETAKIDSATSAPAVGAEAATATLTVKVTYAVLSVKQSEYTELVRAQELKQIGPGNQIYEDGLDTAEVTVSDKDPNGRQTFHLTTEAYGGKKLDTAVIAKTLKGQRYGDAMNLAKQQPGVTQAELEVKPGWATHLPNRTSKINIAIQVAGNK